MEDTTVRTFAKALRDIGVQRLRLDQVVTAYHKTFPAEAMRADMRRRLHDVIVELLESGVVLIPDGVDALGDDPLSLPLSLQITEHAPAAYFQ